MNKVLLMGRVKEAPYLKISSQKKEILKFTVETKKEFEGKTYLTSHFISIFQNNLLGFCKQHLKKDDAVFIEGELCYSTHEEKKYTEIRAVNLQIMDYLK